MIVSFFLTTLLVGFGADADSQANHKPEPAAATHKRPNFVILFADDLGYGDLGCYGNPTLRTPNLDRMAAEGMKFTQFYSVVAVCTPSRAALLTGRLPIRSGMNKVLFPYSKGGLPAEEVTIAEALHDAGYATACIGKWHLGHLPPYLPTRHGFDHYFGIPYSNDMTVEKRGDPPLPLMRDEAIAEQPADQTTLTRRYTDEALAFIDQHEAEPFFVYVPFTFPHVPLYASKEFEGTSPRGLYGDVVEEIDHSVGRILQHLKDKKLADNTFVFFTSDNGPWLIKDLHGGSAGLLREGKGTTWEGGIREPGIAWWPGHIPAGVTTQQVATTCDLLPTLLGWAGVSLPDRQIDGVNLDSVMEGSKPIEHPPIFYYSNQTLHAVRVGKWKVHYYATDHNEKKRKLVRKLDPPQVYDLLTDPSERFDVGKEHPEVIAKANELVSQHQSELTPGAPQE